MEFRPNPNKAAVLFSLWQGALDEFAREKKFAVGDAAGH
jgi:hypothetical protein